MEVIVERTESGAYSRNKVSVYIYIYISIYISIYIYIYIYIGVYTHTGCPRRNGQYFGRVFLRSDYTDITQNTYIQSAMVTEILAREKCGLLWCLRTVLCP
jgi:hypothetical protein